jgi:hypothetical protein
MIVLSQVPNACAGGVVALSKVAILLKVFWFRTF